MKNKNKFTGTEHSSGGIEIIAEVGLNVSMPSNTAIYDLDIVDEIDQILESKCETLDNGSNVIIMNGDSWQELIIDLYKLVKKYEKKAAN